MAILVQLPQFCITCKASINVLFNCQVKALLFIVDAQHTVVCGWKLGL